MSQFAGFLREPLCKDSIIVGKLQGWGDRSFSSHVESCVWKSNWVKYFPYRLLNPSEWGISRMLLDALLSLRSKQLVWSRPNKPGLPAAEMEPGPTHLTSSEKLAVAAPAGLWTPPLEMRVNCIAENWRTRELIIHNNSEFCQVGCRHFTFYLVFMGNFGDGCYL